MAPIQAVSPAIQTVICISVDTAAVIAWSESNPGQPLQSGIYMVDNQLANGSTNEGALELNTRCNPGDRIGFHVVPIDPTQGDTVGFSGFNVSQGSVFGASGYPQPRCAATSTGPFCNFWVGRAVASGATTYNPQIVITSDDGINHVVSWDPFLSDQS
jgi:hypothetical protein